MAISTKKICRECGKEYKACLTPRNIEDVFRWQDVACSPECGSIYFAKIEASRRPKSTDIKEEIIVGEPNVSKFIDDEDDDEFDNEVDEYFDGIE